MKPNTTPSRRTPDTMSFRMLVYVGSVIAAGVVAVMTAVPAEIPQPLLALTFVAATVVASLFKLRLPLGHGQSTMSMAYVVDFAVLVTLGAEFAVIIAAVGVVVQCTVSVRRPQPWYRTAFSIAAVVLSVRAAAWVWSSLEGGSAVADAMPLLLAAVPYFAVNSGLVATAIALQNGLSPFRYWQQAVASGAAGCFLAAAVVAGINVLMTRDAYLVLALAAGPMALCHVVYASRFRRMTMEAAAAA